MKSLTPMERLREQAEERLDQTTRQLGRARHSCLQAQAQLSQLQAYQREYQQQLVSRAAGPGIPTTHLMNYQGFIQSLGRATQHCGDQVKACEQAVEQALGDWKNQRRRLNAFATLARRAEEAAQAQESRQQQKIMDEFASQRFARNQT
jgi:flagellar protein FliJ